MSTRVWRILRRLCLVPALLALAAILTPVAAAPTGAATLPARLAAAAPGDTLHVDGGTLHGALVIDKPITLLGSNWPVIDAGGEGTVVQINAADVTMQGFLIRASGDSLDAENAGIAVEAPRAIVEGNRFEATLFGVYLRQAHNSVVRGNTIESQDLAVQRRGDAIRVWYSNDVLIEGNVVSLARDVVLWYSERLTVRGNTIRDGRYGLHFMYCDDATIERNQLVDNSVGAFLMYSRRMTLSHNTIARNRGPSGFGVGLKDMDDAIVVDNLFLDNRIGIYLDGSPREVDSTGRINGNLLAYNDIGVELLPAVRRNEIAGNSFVENEVQVSVPGNGNAAGNAWTVDEAGNYWSDYAGFDADGDGIGDVAYAADRLFEQIAGRQPALRLFQYSPVTTALDFAARAFPLVAPQPTLLDTHPRMTSHVPAAPPLPEPAGRGWPAAAFGLLAATVVLAAIGGGGWRRAARGRSATPRLLTDGTMIEFKDVHKAYGAVTALERLTTTVHAGEAVAFWGANGAGKSTALHCLLGLLPFAGRITVGGADIGRHGKAIRRDIGFVPQALTFHAALTVDQTVAFYAGLKGILPDDEFAPLLDQLGLAQQRTKRVGELSGGLRQRLALALALLGDPPILVLDEPTANLDLQAREEFVVLLRRLKHGGKTLLFSSHRLEEVTALADRVLLLENGRLIVDAPPHEIGRRLDRDVTLHLYLAPEAIESATALLDRRGLTVSANGAGLRVRVQAAGKGEVLRALHSAGVPVNDFVVE